jgi:1,4-dihydroxy-2-naphthoate octaprenyltransferase
MSADEQAAPVLSGWRMWLAGARPRTLPAAVVPVLVGTAIAAGVTGFGGEGGWFMYAPNSGVIYAPSSSWLDEALKGLSPARFLAALIVALAIQIGTNYANDYSDGKRGTDDPGQRVGPPRLVGWGLAPPRHVKIAAFASFGVAGLAGLYLAAVTTWWLIPVGVVCFLAGWFYTGGPKPYGYAGLGEVFVFVFFGLVATVGSAYVQTGKLGEVIYIPGGSSLPDILPRSVTGYPIVLWGSAVAIGMLATALLVINNLRDIPSDTISGKRTLAVKLGDRRTRILYIVLMYAPFFVVPIACGLGGRPLGAASLFAVVLVAKPMKAVISGATGPALVPVLGQTGRVQLVFGLLLAAGVFISA